MTEQGIPAGSSADSSRSYAQARTGQTLASEAAPWLAAIVENSDDAILSKTLDGIIMSWNAGAEAVFGYTAEEAIGQPVTIIIPEDRLHEETEILGKLRAGQRIDHFETVRRHKDGRLVDIALTVSPVKDASGNVLGASKIARDISSEKQAAVRQDLLLREMNHRIKNLFALTSSLVALSARAAGSVEDLATDLTSRLETLSRAHSLTLPDLYGDVATPLEATLTALVEVVLAPHDDETGSRISVHGDPAPIGNNSAPTLALLFHELTTNAAKYGALAAPGGHLDVSINVLGSAVRVIWLESRGPEREERAPRAKGFGSRLEQASVSALQGTLNRVWQHRGLEIHIQFPLAQLIR